MEDSRQSYLDERIRDHIHISLRAHNIRDDDAVSIKTLKLLLVGRVLDIFGLDWGYLVSLFKTHTPVHPEMAKALQCEEEEVNQVLAQVFVRNEKLIRLLKVFAQNGKNVNRLLAVDGMAHHGLTFEQKHYIGHLRYGASDTFFEKGPEYRRLHVQTVRQMYDMLEGAPVPEKQVYEILRQCLEEMQRFRCPKVEFGEGEELDPKRQAEVGRFYMQAMGRENVQLYVRNVAAKRFRGEKRPHGGEREDREAERGEKNQAEA